jgi:hypothetical protein
MLNTLVLGKLMKLGIFNRDTAFEKAPGVGVFPGPGEEMYYSGSSLGGIHGTWLAGLTPDIERSVASICYLPAATIDTVQCLQRHPRSASTTPCVRARLDPHESVAPTAGHDARHHRSP